MFKNQIYRTLLAVATIATLWSLPARSQAAELHPMVVVGIPANEVALNYPIPEYPRTALSLHISGDVMVRVRVENGQILDATASSTSSVLAEASKHWILGQWKFKPTVNGVVTIPISYKESA